MFGRPKTVFHSHDRVRVKGRRRQWVWSLDETGIISFFGEEYPVSVRLHRLRPAKFFDMAATLDYPNHFKVSSITVSALDGATLWSAGALRLTDLLHATVARDKGSLRVPGFKLDGCRYGLVIQSSITQPAMPVYTIEWDDQTHEVSYTHQMLDLRKQPAA